MKRIHQLLLIAAGCVLSAGCEPMPDETAAPPVESLDPMKAQVGVGVKGRSLDNEQGVGKMISAPVSVYFSVKEKMAFEVALPKAVSLFQASEGRLPKSHEEYMEKIIKFNQIKLPELPAGMVYRYKPDLGELWVEPTGGAAGNNPAPGTTPLP